MLLFFCFPFAFFPFVSVSLLLCSICTFYCFFWVSLLFCSISLFFCHLTVSFVFSGFFFMSLFWQEVGSERARGRLRSNRGRFKTKALPHPSSLEEGGFAYHFSLGVPFPYACFFSFVFPLPFFLLFRYLCFYVLYALFIAFFGYLCFSVLYLFSFAILLFLLYFRVSFLCLFSGRR